MDSASDDMARLHVTDGVDQGEHHAELGGGKAPKSVTKLPEIDRCVDRKKRLPCLSMLEE